MSGRPFKRAAAALCCAALFTAAAPAQALEPSPTPPETATDRVWSWMISEIATAWSALTAFTEEPADPTATNDPGPGTNEGWLVDPNG